LNYNHLNNTFREMAKRKTESDYAAAITELHQQRLEYPDSAAIIKKIDTQVRGWMRRVDIAIQVAQNEQTPWTAEMIGYQTEPMPSKKSSGFAQIGDYAGVVKTSDGDRYVLYCVKESPYRTLMARSSWRRTEPDSTARSSGFMQIRGSTRWL